MDVVEMTGAIRHAKLQSYRHHQHSNTQFFLHCCNWMGMCPCRLPQIISRLRRSIVVRVSVSLSVSSVNEEAQAAKEMLLMATSADEQKMWVQRLSKKVSKKGITQQQQVTSGPVGDRSAPGYVNHSPFCVCVLRWTRKGIVMQC